MKRVGFVLILVMVTVSMLLAGCGEEEEATPTPTPTPEATATPVVTATPTPVVTPTPTPELTPTPTQAVDEQLTELLNLAAGIESDRYDFEASYAGMTIPTTVWLKGNKMRTEASIPGMGDSISIIDFDAQTMYTQIGGQTMTVDIGQAPISPVAQAFSIEDYSPAIVGTETIDGKECAVVEYTIADADTTMWIWKEYGFPVKVESITTQGTVTVEYKNIDFSPIDDSMFEIP